MTLALQFFYQSPIVRMQVNLPGIGTPVNEEFVLSMEMESSDELARFWQAVTAPIRLSVVYKVSIILLTPPATPSLAAPVHVMELATNPALFPFASLGQVTGTTRTLTFTTPLVTQTGPEIVTLVYSPAVVAPGQRFILVGAGLNQSGPAPVPESSDRVYLIAPGGTPIDVTDNWKTHKGSPDEKNFQTDARITLDLPSAVGALPANSPSPGIYQLCAGGNSPSYRTNSVPFSIAARIDVSDPPILTTATETYTVQGEGFIPQRTEVLLDTLALVENSGGALQKGQFTVDSGQQISFQAPDALAPGLYTLRVRVNSVESPPSWWISV